MEQSTTTKVCTRCGKELPLTAFYRQPKGKFGCTSECRECHKIQMRRYHADKRRAQVPPTNQRNPKFADKTPRELQQKMRELKEELIARGFNCKIECTYLNTIII